MAHICKYFVLGIAALGCIQTGFALYRVICFSNLSEVKSVIEADLTG